MMHSKSKIKVFQTKGIIEINTTFVKMMQNPLSDEYALLQKTKMENPTFTVRRRQINSNPHKDTYKGLTYAYMKKYIKLHETKEEAETVIAYLEDQILISKCHGQSLRYPTIKKWFLHKYPDVAKFGTEYFDAEETTVNQGAIPFNPNTPSAEQEELLDVG